MSLYTHARVRHVPVRVAGPGIQQDNVPFLCLSQKQQGAAEQQQRQQRCVQQVPDLLWDGSSNSSRAEAAGGQLFALPAFYQPRVKDLEAPDISSMLSAEGLCTVEAETNIEVPVVEPVEVSGLNTLSFRAAGQHDPSFINWLG